MLFSILIMTWILFQVLCKIYYNVLYPEKAVMYLRETSSNPLLAIIGYLGWGFLMATAFYFAGLFNF